MHISDGIINNNICIVGHFIALGWVYMSGRKAESEDIPKMGITAAALFVISLIHIPIGGTSLHPGLFGITGIILGKRAFPVIFSVLLFQALIFQHGGLLSLGLNALNMGIGAHLAFYIWQQKFINEHVKSFLAGFVGAIIPVVLMALEFRLSGYGKGILVIFSIYILVAVFEGFLALFVVNFFRKVKSDIIS